MYNIGFRLNNDGGLYRKGFLDIPEDYNGRVALYFLRNEINFAKIKLHPRGDIGKYEDLYTGYLDRILGHYFRVIYSIMKYTDQCSDISDKDKKFYIHMLRAQISSDELYFIFFSGLSKYGKDKLKPLIEKYSFFEHIRDSKISSTELIEYSKEAYGENLELISKYKIQEENQKHLRERNSR